jgi:hypothetical protein
MAINSVAGSPTARGGRLARAARMWWTPEQGGLHPAYGSTLEVAESLSKVTKEEPAEDEAAC